MSTLRAFKDRGKASHKKKKKIKGKKQKQGKKKEKKNNYFLKKGINFLNRKMGNSFQLLGLGIFYGGFFIFVFCHLVIGEIQIKNK